MTRSDVFISYSHADAKWLKKLRPFLKPMERKGILHTWDDTRIKPGSKWIDEIKHALARTKIAVLLVSQDFLASEFITDQELPHFLKASEKEGLTILWLPLSASTWQDSPLADFQAATDPLKPLDSMPPAKLKVELVNLARQIRGAVNP
jgi:hypothetical protein